MILCFFCDHRVTRVGKLRKDFRRFININRGFRKRVNRNNEGKFPPPVSKFTWTSDPDVIENKCSELTVKKYDDYQQCQNTYIEKRY